ncbi:MAG: hypothetical protein WA369_13040 [Candidatus Acidiferrales bacterium]
MTEFVRKDTAIISEQTMQAAPITSDSRTLVTPPPSDVRSGASLTSDSPAATAAVRAVEEERVALFPSTEANELRARWDSIQVGFVDEPRKAVAEADALVSATMNRLSEIFSRERQGMEEQWGPSDNPSTEDFRVALRRYRSFFSRLLSI